MAPVIGLDQNWSRYSATGRIIPDHPYCRVCHPLTVPYAGFGLVSEARNHITSCFNQLQSGFAVATFLIAGSLTWRRAVFIGESTYENRAKPAPEEII